MARPASPRKRFSVFEFSEEDERAENTSEKLLGKFGNPKKSSRRRMLRQSSLVSIRTANVLEGLKAFININEKPASFLSAFSLLSHAPKLPPRAGACSAQTSSSKLPDSGKG